MPLGNFSVGRDVTLRIVTDTGILKTARLTAFDSKQEVTELTSAGIDGIFETEYQPKRWVGSFMFDRRDSSVDTYFAQLEADFFNGVARRAASIVEIVTDPSGAVHAWTYQNVALRLEEAGNWSGEALVKQRIGFAAARRVQNK